MACLSVPCPRFDLITGARERQSHCVASISTFDQGLRRRPGESPMTDVTAAGPPRRRLKQFPDSALNFGAIGAMLKRGDIALAIGVLTILVVLILPLPPLLLDLALAISIILSVLILMTALFIHTPLEFSAFPTVLLISTMLRLALNLASTRLILAHGHEGTHAAGHVIEAFGNFVMARQLRHRHHRLHHPGDRELRRHHQGLRPHRRGRGALPPRRHARQADGDRRRPLRRPDRRDRGASGAARRWRTKAASSAPWTAPRSSCAATPSPACWWCSSTSSAA